MARCIGVLFFPSYRFPSTTTRRFSFSPVPPRGFFFFSGRLYFFSLVSPSGCLWLARRIWRFDFLILFSSIDVLGEFGAQGAFKAFSLVGNDDTRGFLEIRFWEFTRPMMLSCTDYLFPRLLCGPLYLYFYQFVGFLTFIQAYARKASKRSDRYTTTSACHNS